MFRVRQPFILKPQPSIQNRVVSGLIADIVHVLAGEAPSRTFKRAKVKEYDYVE